jgi:hypothetical protein
MSYSHNPFLVLSDSQITSEFVDVAYRLKTAENKLKDTLFLIPSTTQFVFDDVLELLPLFQLYTSGSVSITDQTYTGNPIKIHLKINIKYQWIGAEYAARYSLVVKKNNSEILFNISKGIEDSAETMNKLHEDGLIDLSNGDQITITLFKDQIETHDTITLMKNSYISFGIV